MQTTIEKIDKNHLDKKIIQKAGQIIKDGGIVAFPTETVYGLGADGLNPDASKKIYEAKGRPSDNPLIIHIATIKSLEKLAVNIPKTGRILANKFWPGPLTMIFDKSEIVPFETTGGLDSVAVRFPSDETAQALIEAGGGFICAPSANISGRPSPTNGRDVAEDMNGKIDMILDGGDVDIGVESTILDMTVNPPMILRPGAITKKMLTEVIGYVAIDHSILPEASLEKPKAPGMKYRHYAPRAPLTLVQGNKSDTMMAIQILVRQECAKGRKTAIIASTETASIYQQGLVKVIGSRTNEESIAQNLYRVLREFDRDQVDCIFSEMFDENGLGAAIMNRLGKAAGHRIIQAEEVIRSL